jgi:hypothetical protein
MLSRGHRLNFLLSYWSHKAVVGDMLRRRRDEKDRCRHLLEILFKLSRLVVLSSFAWKVLEFSRSKAYLKFRELPVATVSPSASFSVMYVL